MSIQITLRSVLSLAVSAILLTACSDHDRPPDPTPKVQGLQDQTISQDTSTGPLAFQLADADTVPDSLNVQAQSSDTALIPPDGIVFGGSGTNRTIQITPAVDATGSATITVSATDPGGLTGRQSFVVKVNGVLVSFVGKTNEAFGKAEDDTPLTVSGVTYTPDADEDDTAFDSLLQ